MTINPASLPTVPPSPRDAQPMQMTVGELPVGSAQKVGDYKILGTLGSGGMGVVYKAFDQKLGRVVALKMLHVGREPNDEELARFRAEAAALGKLQHPNIVQVFDVGVQDNAPYLVMEYVNGGSLDKRLQNTPQPPRRAAEWLEQVARSVHFAHENGVVHRDLKPGNVLLSVEGTPKITDFGLAKQMGSTSGLTQTGAIMGTPSYMAPEQALGKKDVGPPADVYALGAILYECLTGRPPFRGATLQETLEQVCHADPAPPSRLVPRLPRDLQTVCLKCLEKAPGQRYHSALELADDLKCYLDGMPVKARPTHSLERLFRIVARRPLHAALAACAALLLTMGVVFVVGWYAWSKERAIVAQQQHGVEREKLHKEQIEALQKEKFALTRAEADQSLETLNKILAVALDGSLKDVPGLEPLFAELRAYYDRLVANVGTKDWVDEAKVARACYNLGRLYRKRGEYANAQEAFDKADRLFGRVNAGEEATARTRYEQARVRMERGQVNASFLGAWKKADEDYARCIEQVTALVRDERDDLAPKRLLGELHHSRAMLWASHPDRDSRDRAAREYDEALAVRRSLVGLAKNDKLADDRGDLARTYGWQGDLFLDLGDPVRADTAYRRSFAERKKLADDHPDDDAKWFQLSRGLQNFGVFLTRVRALATAKYYFGQANQMVTDLIEKKRIAAAEYKGDQSSYRNWDVELSLLTLEGAPPKGALEALLAACDLNARTLDAAIAQDATSLDPRSNKAICLVHRARVLTLLGRSPQATADLDEARRTFAALAEKRPSAHEQYQWAAALALRAAGADRREAADLEAQSLKALREAIRLDYRRLHVEDVRRDVAFAKMAKNADFDTTLRDRAAELQATRP